MEIAGSPADLGAKASSSPPLILYLDQNMWVEVARIALGKNRERSDVALLATLVREVSSGRWLLPLSAVHYVELARVSNIERRERLGGVMFDLSRGVTLACTRKVIEHEIETSLARRWSHVEVRPFELLGVGVGHAFAVPLPARWNGPGGPQLERSVLAGDRVLGIHAPSFHGQEHRENFRKHLEQMKVTRTLPASDWENALGAISMIDILEPLNEILIRNGLDKNVLSALVAEELTSWLKEMPSRRVDWHLHRQVLKDATYLPKITDLEDWAGLGIATAYCDIVACEKHMAAMLTRERFRERAVVVRRLADAVNTALTWQSVHL